MVALPRPPFCLRATPPPHAQFLDNAAGTDLTTMSPYLGAAVHVVVVEHVFFSVMHIHGMPHMPGMNHSCDHAHQMGMPPPPAWGPMGASAAQFQRQNYTAFVQADHNDQTIVVARFDFQGKLPGDLYGDGSASSDDQVPDDGARPLPSLLVSALALALALVAAAVAL